eukprot:8546079-Lingulodinium_polyedra.AAC.1
MSASAKAMGRSLPLGLRRGCRRAAPQSWPRWGGRAAPDHNAVQTLRPSGPRGTPASALRWALRVPDLPGAAPAL